MKPLWRQRLRGLSHGLVAGLSCRLLLKWVQSGNRIQYDEKHFRQIVEMSPQPVVVILNNLVVYANEAGRGLLGASELEELKGKSVFEIVHPDFHAETRQWMQQILLQNIVSPILSQKMVRLNGEILDVEVRSNRILYRGQKAIQTVIQNVSNRKRIEAELRASEARFKSFMDSSPAFASIKDETGRYIYLNQKAHQLFAAPVSEVVGHGDTERLPPQTALRLRANDLRVLSTGQPKRFMENLVLADGFAHDLLIDKFLLEAENGRRLIAGIAVDITDRVQLEKSLRQSERILRAVSSSMPIMLFAVDGQGVITLAETESTETHFQRDWGQVGESAWQCFADSPPILENIRRGLSGETFYSEVTVEGHLLDIYTAPLIADDGQNDGFIAIAMDITEQRRAKAERDQLVALEQTARAEAEKERKHVIAILDSIADGFYALDQQWRFTYVNRAAEQILSLSSQELVGRSLWESFPEMQGTRFQDEYQRAMREGKTAEFEAFYSAFGAWYAVRAYPAPDGLSVFFLDISARKEAEAVQKHLLERITTAQEEERWRIARDFHDQLGQDLAVLMLGLKALPQHGPLAPTAQACVRELQETVTQLTRQVRHVALNLRSEALGTLGLLAAVKSYTEEWSHHHGVPVTLHCWGFQNREVAPHVEATVYRIMQESFTNVSKHAGARHVSVVIEHRDDHILLIIEDDGQGFDLESVKNKPLMQRGLGLQGMRERIALLNGTLQIESRVGGGTTLFVRVSADANAASIENHDRNNASLNNTPLNNTLFKGL